VQARWTLLGGGAAFRPARPRQYAAKMPESSGGVGSRRPEKGEGDRMTVRGEDALGAALEWRAGGREVALVTVIRAWDSAPCPVGSLMAVDQGGVRVGSVSAGLIEEVVVERALEAMADGESRLLGHTVTDARAKEAGLACGGGIELFLQPVGPLDGQPDLLERLVRAQAEQRAVAFVTDLVMGLQSLVFESVVHGGFGLDEPALAMVRDLLAIGQSAVIEPTEDSRLFVHVFVPRLRDSTGADALA